MSKSLPIRLLPLLAAAAALSGGLAAAPPAAGQAGNPPAVRSAAAAEPGTPAATASAPAQVPAERIQMMRPTAAIEIQAEPAKVWKRLVSEEGMAAFGKRGEGRMQPLVKVGDHARAGTAGDQGNIVVTHVEKNAVWRAAWEPDSGHYVCSMRFDLRPQGKATLLTYGEWYSEEKPAGADATLAGTRKEMAEGLARFKALVEKASAGQ